jgi:hypothetical protein
MNLNLNRTSFLEEISTFENYIKNNFHEFDNSDGKSKDEMNATNLAFKLFELQEFQKRARAYNDFLNYCSPESDSHEVSYIQTVGQIHDFLFWLVSEIDATQKSLQP